VSSFAAPTGFAPPAPVIPLPPLPSAQQSAAPSSLRIEALPASAPVSAFSLEPAASPQAAAPFAAPSAHTSAQPVTPTTTATGNPSPASAQNPFANSPASSSSIPAANLHAKQPEPAASAPELVPVPASIFDDDFFRASATRSLPPEPQPERETPPRYDAIASGRAAFGENRILELEHAPIEAPARVPSFVGLAASPADNGDADELDIPAFLRRGH
jgi:cell division protein FtsZ